MVTDIAYEHTRVPGAVLKEDEPNGSPSFLLQQMRSIWALAVEHRRGQKWSCLAALSLFKEGVFAWQAWMCVCVGPCLKIFIPKIARTPCVYFNAFTTQIQDQCYNQESSITPCYHKICFAEFSLHFLLIVLHIFRIPIRIYFNQFGSHKTHYLLNLRFQEIVDNVNVFSSKFILHTIIKV